MKGQWIGQYAGTNEGQIIVNVDERQAAFEGMAFVNEKSDHLPHFAAFFTTPNKHQDISFRTSQILPIHPHTGTTDYWDNVKQFFGKDIAIPEYADVACKWTETNLTMSWKTNIGSYGSCELPSSNAGKVSELVPIPDVTDWASYKKYVSTLGVGNRLLFRGQNKPWRLRTSFHRTSRADLFRFLNEDIQILLKHLSARTRHVFNLENRNENGAFFNLVQHHGYPTPLLDWTYSPYVAAFFAYRGITNQEAASEMAVDKKVRIHIFDQAKWNVLPQIRQVLHYTPHLSIGEFLAIENERMRG